jgi:hypothetical protein
MKYKEFLTINDLNNFLIPYSIEECIIVPRYPIGFYVWVNYILTECPHCHKQTPENGKYCAWCGENL